MSENTTEDRTISAANSTADLRGAFLNQVKKLLVGPFSEAEILPSLEGDPSDIYLTGILWPQNMVIGPSEDENTEQADAEGTDPGDDSGAPLFSILKPSSMGLTCSIEGADTPFAVIVRGARYRPSSARNAGREVEEEDKSGLEGSQIAEDNNESDRLSGGADWNRQPFEYRVPVTGPPTTPRTNEFINCNGERIRDDRVSVYVKRRVNGGTQIVTASLINEAMRVDGDRPGSLSLFQTELEIRSVDRVGNGMIIARPPDYGMADEDSRSGDLLYRHSSEFAVGHGIAPVWPEPINGRVTSVSTEWMPEARVYSVSRSGDPRLTSIRTRSDSPFLASFLSRHDRRDDIVKGLEEFADTYGSWIQDQKNLSEGLSGVFRSTATDNLGVCIDTLRRMKDGIELLASDDIAFRSFCLANEAMDAQSNGRQRGDTARPLVWFPFQLAFLLLSIRSIVQKDDPTRRVMDLLWFPTGGGKTEAYLGLTAFTIFHRRLSGSEREKNSGHVDVLMRYTLRLLTVQQFQRAAALICAAERIRKQRNDLGSEPISIGLFVGQGATPNRLVEGGGNAIEILDAERRGLQPSSTPRLLLNCPLCGSDLSTDSYRVDRSVPTLEIVCPNPTCPSGGDPLPVYTVDDDVYRKRPSLVIGTVDKFAQLPRKADQGLIFGHPEGLPPELIIQDELHLISGPLGTVTGLYESCIDLLCTRGDIPPKIIGSTATIGRARQQVRALFQRDVLQFPPSALNADDSFFAVTDRAAPDRSYVGISSAGRSPKFTLQALTAAVLVAAQKLRLDGEDERMLDPYWTALLYFNSLRELGGAEVMMHDDVPRTMDFYSKWIGCAARELEGQPAELNSRIPSTRIPQILKDLEIGLQSDPFAGDPIDLVLASNMISVGMDIPRLGLMVVQGQPKTTSEYIQATSRVGRGTPGLVFTLYNASRPRDMSHFEHFTHYHETLYRRVEVTSVTPWSSRARDRALHAVFIAAVRHLVPGMSGRFGAAGFDPRDPKVLKIKEWMIRRAREAGAEHVTLDQISEDLQNIIDRWSQAVRKHQRDGKFEYWATSRPFDNRPVNPHLMRGAENPVIDHNVWPTPGSMREVEPSAYYVLTESTTEESN